MCIIAIKKKSAQFPKVETIKKMCDNNPDGFAIVYHIKGKGVKSMRSLNSDDVYKLYRQLLRYSHKNVSFFMHARVKTHGTINANNCHGWHSDECKMYFAHNGILSVKNRGDMTDSETFFRDIFTPAYLVGGWNAAKLTIDACIGTSKFVFMDDNGAIEHFGQYIEDEGMLYSNSTYKDSRYSYSTWGGGYSSYYDNYTDCTKLFKVGDRVVATMDGKNYKVGDEASVTSVYVYGMNIRLDEGHIAWVGRYDVEDFAKIQKSETAVPASTPSKETTLKIGQRLWLKQPWYGYAKDTEFEVELITNGSVKLIEKISQRPFWMTMRDDDKFTTIEPQEDSTIDCLNTFQSCDILECISAFALEVSGVQFRVGDNVLVHNVYQTGLSGETEKGYVWIPMKHLNKFIIL
jgi:hypothetical protein